MANEDYKAKEKERLAKRDAARLPQRQAQREEAAEELRKGEPQRRRDRLFDGLIDGRGSSFVCLVRGPSMEFRIDSDYVCREWKDNWRQRYLESADFLELAQREDEPTDEFVYRLSEDCRHYLEYVADILKRGAEFCLPTEGPAARISRLGLMPWTYSCCEEGGSDCCEGPWIWAEHGHDDAISGDAADHLRDCFSAPDAARLAKSCYGYLYDNAPHVMACLDVDDAQARLALWRMPDGSPADPCKPAEWVWRWRLEERPPREQVYGLGILRPKRRGARCKLAVPDADEEQAREQDRKQGKQARSSRWIEMHTLDPFLTPTMCDQCLHLFGSEDDRPGWSGACDECKALRQEGAKQAAKRRRGPDRLREPSGFFRCGECVDVFGSAERPSWSHCHHCDGFWSVWNGEDRGLPYTEVQDCVNT